MSLKVKDRDRDRDETQKPIRILGTAWGSVKELGPMCFAFIDVDHHPEIRDLPRLFKQEGGPGNLTTSWEYFIKKDGSGQVRALLKARGTTPARVNFKLAFHIPADLAVLEFLHRCGVLFLQWKKEKTEETGFKGLDGLFLFPRLDQLGEIMALREQLHKSLRS